MSASELEQAIRAVLDRAYNWRHMHQASVHPEDASSLTLAEAVDALGAAVKQEQEKPPVDHHLTWGQVRAGMQVRGKSGDWLTIDFVSAPDGPYVWVRVAGTEKKFRITRHTPATVRMPADEPLAEAVKNLSKHFTIETIAREGDWS